jgi:hypothetical protein
MSKRLRISFTLCQDCTEALFLMLQASQRLMNAPAQAELVRQCAHRSPPPPCRHDGLDPVSAKSADLSTNGRAGSLPHLHHLQDCLAALGLEFLASFEHSLGVLTPVTTKRAILVEEDVRLP